MHRSIFASRKRTNLFAILLGLCLSMILHLVLSLPGAMIMNMVKNPNAAVGIVGITTHLLCGAITAFAVCKYKADGAVFCCLICSLGFFALALAVGLIKEGSVTLTSIINSAIYSIECTLFAAIFKRLGKRRR